jgi:hypothetical protein
MRARLRLEHKAASNTKQLHNYNSNLPNYQRLTSIKLTSFYLGLNYKKNIHGKPWFFCRPYL